MLSHVQWHSLFIPGQRPHGELQALQNSGSTNLPLLQRFNQAATAAGVVKVSGILMIRVQRRRLFVVTRKTDGAHKYL
jgi:hypothetical protein